MSELSSGRLTVQQLGEFKPEAVKSYEIGYRGLMENGKLLFDAYYYRGNYQNFITRVLVAQSITSSPKPTDILTPSTRRIISFPINAPTIVKTTGWGVSLEYRFPKGFS